jgi:hypothetical protein
LGQEDIDTGGVTQELLLENGNLLCRGEEGVTPTWLYRGVGERLRGTGAAAAKGAACEDAALATFGQCMCDAKQQ